MMWGLALLVSFQLGACSPDMEMLQTEVDVEGPADNLETEEEAQAAMERLHDAEILLESESEMEEEWGWSRYMTPRRRAPTCEWAYCTMMLPAAAAKAAHFNLGRCIGNSKCELRGKVIGAAWEMEGAVKFGCGNCMCDPTGGRLTVTRSFTLFKGSKSFGPFGSFEITIGASLSIGVGMDSCCGGNGKVSISITLGGGVDCVVGPGSASASLSGTVTIHNVNTQSNQGGSPRVSVSAMVTFGVEVAAGRKFELKVRLANSGEWEVPNPLENRAIQVIIHAVEKYVAPVVKKKAEEIFCGEKCEWGVCVRLC
jgi:hypothetical protein